MPLSSKLQKIKDSIDNNHASINIDISAYTNESGKDPFFKCPAILTLNKTTYITELDSTSIYLYPGNGDCTLTPDD